MTTTVGRFISFEGTEGVGKTTAIEGLCQRLQAAGYRTGYFGKWHVERTNDLERFGWQVNGAAGTAYYDEKRKALGGERHPAGTSFFKLKNYSF